MILEESASLFPISVLALIVSILMTGCFQRKGIDPSKLIHNEKAEIGASGAAFGEAKTERLLGILRARKRKGDSAVDELKAVRALQEVSEWRSGDNLPKNKKCFPGIGAVVDLFDDPSIDVRYQAVETAGRIGCPDIQSDLQWVKSKDSSPLVREAADLALIRLGVGDEVWAE